MKKTIHTLLFLGCLFASQAQEKSIEAEIRRLEQLEVEAVANRDTIALSALWDKGYVVNAPDNKINFAGKSVADRPVLSRPRLDFTREVEEIVVNGNVAFSMGNETVIREGSQPGKRETVKRRYTNVWMNRDGVWKLSARHANIICR